MLLVFYIILEILKLYNFFLNVNLAKYVLLLLI